MSETNPERFFSYLDKQTISFAPSVVLGDLQFSDHGVHRHGHTDAYATGEGFLFKNFLPMKEANNGKPNSRSARFLGTPWSHVRDAYLRSLRSCFRSTRYERAYWVTDNFSDNYFHWFCYVLPKLYLISRHEPEAVILLPHWLERLTFVTKSIGLLKFKRVVFIKKGESARVARLFTITKPALRQDLLKPVQSLVLGAFPAGDSGERVFISRRDAHKRRAVNEDEIHTILVARGFTVVSMADLDFEQQVGAMQSCRTLVSIHGAGLTNMLFMPPNGQILEIRNENLDAFIRLASALGHKHYTLPAHRTEKRSSHRSDLLIDPGVLEAALDNILGSGAGS